MVLTMIHDKMILHQKIIIVIGDEANEISMISPYIWHIQDGEIAKSTL
jgi:hypothetical protein